MKRKTKSILAVLLLLSICAEVFCGCESVKTGVGASTDTEDITKATETVTTSAGDDFLTDVSAEPDVYELSTDPALYTAVEVEEYGLSKNDSGTPCAFELSGTLRSATGTSLNLVVEWQAVRSEGEDVVKFTADIAVEHKKIACQNFIGHFYINDNEYVFMSPFYEYNHSDSMKEWLCPVSLDIPCGYLEDTEVEVRAVWEFEGRYENTSLSNITIDASVPIGEKYAALKDRVAYETEIIQQNPELPEGCEVTSLAILLGYLGFDVTHTYLADNYLEQGEVGKVSYYEYNLGNPRKAGESWGCYSPVIVKTANKYLYDMESYYRAYDLTGSDIIKVYYELSMGNPAIVWVTMGFAEPYTKSPWNIDGRKLYWKYPLHCVLLTGYDLEARTVTIADPQKKAPVTVDMDLFELRWKQMESQAVVIKESKAK